ncbi:nif-specific transcriptional activator NifA [Candidatus Dependentiae bacterium]|nr:nif-specific transcriptional activator NifA [Candidatus Dependentiae bacterium]
MKTSESEKIETISVKKTVSELSLLFDINQILDLTADLKTALYNILKKLAEVRGMTRGTLTILNRKTGELNIETAFGLSKNQQERGKYKLGEGITGKVVQSGCSAVIPLISKNPLFLNKTGARTDLKKKDISFICVPIKTGTETIGALSVDRLFADTVSLDEDVRLLSIIATMIAQAVKLRQTFQEKNNQLIEENIRLQEELKNLTTPTNIIGNSNSMHKIYQLIYHVAKSNSTVLIRGESGTGKELVANAIHFSSLRATGPFVKINCSALPESIIESELFGHEKGAFTGALSQRKGRFELADNGTIFLDEIGDLSPNLQVKLLRVLQEKEFERVGGAATIKINARIIAATNRNLEKFMSEEKFREDLYYRLNVFPIHLPPLRERKTDIPLLADFFIEKYNKINNKNIRRISTPAIDMLMSYHWPGNIRELENCIERAVLLSSDDVLHSHHLPPTLQTAEESGTTFTGTLEERLERVEKELILDSLKSTNGNMSKAAQILGITERIIGLRVKKFNIEPKRFSKKTKKI